MITSITWFLFSSRLRIFLSSVVCLVGLYALVGFVILPWLIRPRVVETIAELTGRETRLDTLKLNPFTFSGSISGFEITDLDGESLLSVEKAYANVQPFFFLFTGNVHLKKADVHKPYFRLQVNQDGSLNIADLINQATAMMAASETEESDPKTIRLDFLRVTDGAIRFDDLSRTADFTSIISPISFDLNGFHTGGESDAPYSFTASSESGETFSWEGFVAFNPLHSTGSFSVTGVSMPKYEPFYDIILATDVISGTFGVSGSYDYTSGEAGVMLLRDAAINIENVEVVKSDDQSPIISLALGSITGARVDALARSLEVDAVTLSNGSLYAKRLPDGQIDLIQLIDQSAFSPATADDADTPTEEASETEADVVSADAPPAPSYAIHSVVLEGFTIEVIDEAIANPAIFALDNATLKAEEILSEIGAPITIAMSADSRAGGSISVEGSVAYQPVKGSLALDVSELALESGNPYLSEFADVQITGGHASVSGQATIDLSGEVPAGGFDGRFSLGDLDIAGSEGGESLVHLTRLDLEEITASLEPKSVAVGAITVVDPQASVMVYEDGSINLLKALRMGDDTAEEVVTEEVPEEEAVEVAEATEAVEGVEKPTGLGLDFPITIGSITLENASATVTDRSITPSVTLGLETLSGTISGLSSEELARADLDLAGELTGGTKLAITGKINPLIADRYSDVTMTFKGFNLVQVSPYSGKYAGYALDKGKLSFDLNYSVSQAELDGENKMVIDQLTLGEKVESEDALKLPIPLAISLMKDKEGVIEIDVPVTGNLNDPEFGFGRVISRAIVNVLTKIITSPFSMLGNLVPGGADMDLSFVAFTPGSTEFDDETIEKLGLMAKALDERPTLNLDIIGTAGGRAESNLLKTQQLDDNLRVIRWRELKDAGDKSLGLAEVVLTPEDRDRLIIHSFNLMFPTQAVDPEAAMEEAGDARTIAQDASADPTEAADETDAVAASAPAEDDAPGGLAGFFKRVFGGGSKSSAEEPAPPPPAVATAPVPEPETTVAQAEEPQATETPQAELESALTVDQMASRLLETLEVSSEDLYALADARADAVRVHLETDGAIAPERLFVIEPEDLALISADGGEAQVVFELE